MPEGPSIVILKEEVQALFTGKEVIRVEGNSKLDIQRIAGKTITEFKSWGKHFLICLPDFTVRIHFMLFGSYKVNDKKNTNPRLSLQFENGELNFYSCSIKFLELPPDFIYDWSADVMSDDWSPAKAKAKLKKYPDMLACDALLNQDIFAGVGNIIKNEVLFRIKLHPESRVGKLPPKQLNMLVEEARNYSFDFLKWKKAYVLKKHWLAHTKRICPRDNVPFIKKYLGKTHRRTFYCEMCQKLYA
jgi:endonuclease-8